ncbi:TlpA family protein disulfide reductase [Mucilaginibacter agri]|uniref:Redoxin domain-containing protein n=1 Tax=Mucilaginibacter agri TaxID=2695265 RepID=A0A965ZGE0_9SPHI|nr:TlpA disulfide reductase family protein [Mucilaginibacter agri]NCD70564.1 redoxin domain-containing protein [Mucilaginibacter agri]
MFKKLCLALLLLTEMAFAYHTTPEPVQKPAAILKDVMSFLYYKRDYLRLTEDFTGYDASMNKISTAEFFRQFATGNYLPLRLKSNFGGNEYRLYPLNAKVNKDLRSVLKGEGETDYRHFKMEAKPLPGLNYTNINGKVYNQQNTKGKIVVLKCWFIACTTCNAEIPELNNLVNRYRNRKDVLFVSLAFDPKDKLVAFSKKTPFNYAIVPVKESYIAHQLNINEYPTHLIVNKQGLVTKVVNTAHELTVALDHEAAK